MGGGSYLCLQCPRCGLYGGTSHTSYKKTDSNIKHRISYSTAFSLEPYKNIEEKRTFNAINNKKSSTGRALGSKNYVMPASLFPSIITLRSITWKEFVWAVKTVLSTHQYGAETRTGGEVRNKIVGIAAGWEELISPLELTLELAEVENINSESIKEILDSYKQYTSHTNKVNILTETELDNIIQETKDFDLKRDFMEESYQDIIDYRKDQEN